MPKTETPLEYLMSRCEPELNTGCWLWAGAPGSGGYGIATIAGLALRAHRLSWVLHKGEIPDALKVLHRCDTPACVNPAHLFLGTQLDNIADMVAKGRQRGVQRFGSASPVSVLTEHSVWIIRNLIDIGIVGITTQREIASLWGVSPMTISRIANRQTWPHVSLDWDLEAA